SEFLPAEELLPTIEAILRVFSEHGNRKNKFKARMKFVLRAKGIAEFRRLVAEKRESVTTPAEVFTVASAVAQPLVQISTAGPAPGSAPVAPASPQYHHWLSTNVMTQRQAGFSTIWIKLAAGTITSAQLRGLATTLERHELAGIRIA